MDTAENNQESEVSGGVSTATTTNTNKSSSSIWPEVKRAFDTKRYELTLIGPEISKRIEDANGQIDANIFKLKQLNFLEIAKTKLTHLPAEIGQNQNLLSLLCHTNAIVSVPSELGKLVLLKNLDLSNNKLTQLPTELENLVELMSINVSGNQLTSLFPLAKLSKLAVLDISRNKFNKLPDDLGSCMLENLSDVNGSFNELDELNENLVDLQSLKKLNLENNQIKQVPACLSQCVKLKELMLKENKLKDNRLKKLVEQDKGKAILEYLEKIYAEESKNKPKKGGASESKGVKKSGGKADTATAQIEFDLIKVLHSQNETFPSREIVVHSESVAELRPHILAVILRHVDLETGSNFKKFLSIQTKLHDETCQKRTLATIATHDLESLKGNLTYQAADPDNVQLVPLGRKNTVFARDYYDKLMEEAEAERKAKKRNQLSGIYKYLTLLEGHDKFVFVSDSQGVISLPPLSNAEKSKISASTKDILVEITSSSSMEICKKVMDELILEMLRASIVSTSDINEKLATLSLQQSDALSEVYADGKLKNTLVVQQVRVVDSKGALKTVFPSRVDFEFDGSVKIRVARLYAD